MSPVSLSRIYLAVFAIAFLVLRPNMVKQGNIYGWTPMDDANYLAHATAIAFGRFPDYRLENTPKGPANHAIGTSLLALPFIFPCSLIDRATGHPIVQKRTPEAMPTSWTPYGFAVSSQIYLLLGILLIFLACRDFVPGAPAGLAVGLSVIASGLPLYAFRRPAFTPVYEFFVFSAGLFLLSSTLRGRSITLKPSLMRPLSVALAAGVFLVRYNNVILAFALIGVLAKAFENRGDEKPNFLRVRKGTIVDWFVLAAVVVVTAVFVKWLGSQYGKLFNDDQVERRLLQFRGVQFYFESLFHVFIGIDWGLVFSAPLILVGLYGHRYMEAGRRYLWPLLAALSVNLALTISWGTQASYFGYRYFVYTALPLATIGLAAWLKNGPGTIRRRTIMVCALSVFPILMMLVFQNARPFTLQKGPNPWSKAGMVHNQFALTVLETVFTDPATIGRAIFGLGGLTLFGRTWAPDVMMKILLCWAWPLLAALFSALCAVRARRKGFSLK